MYHVNGREPEPWELVAVRADLDELGGQPEEISHDATRGAHPELKYDLSNLCGIAASSHRLVHDAGIKVGQFQMKP